MTDSRTISQLEAEGCLCRWFLPVSASTLTSMEKKKGSVWDGIKVAFSIIEAAETLNSGRSGFDEFVHGVKEKVLMGAAIAAVCGLFYVMVFIFHW